MSQMDRKSNLTRRYFLWSGAGLGVAAGAHSTSPSETVYHLDTSAGRVQMSVEFLDGYRSAGFWFKEHFGNKSFCLSKTGKEDSKCLDNFHGSIAIARYKLNPAGASRAMSIREHVQTIDHDARLEARPPFERSIEWQQGVASDIQAFGYEAPGGVDANSTDRQEGRDLWCLLRQDLFFDRETYPFLVVHWKHSLSAIRLLDVIPGDETRFVGG